MTYQFNRDPESGMILVTVWLDDENELKMALDTGATRTTFDFNALHLAEYPVKDITEKGAIETANGIIDVGVFKVDSLSAFGHTKRNMKVQVYDFLAHGILSDYEGVLGLDFFENTAFRIDMKNQTIEVEECV
ncbi:MAG: aspartyl protease family protein [Marinilabiliaceae bacterium]|nr:aspartyl protease family protein [Marinilabiliaceae bacterium]